MSLHDPFYNLNTSVKYFLDLASYAVAGGVIAQVLPVAATLLSVIWLGLQIFTWFRRKGWQTDAEKERDA